MNKKKILPVVLAGSMIGETLISARHFEGLAPQPHIEFEITMPIATTVSSIPTGMVSVVYISSGFMDKNDGGPGQMTEPIWFASVEDAMRAPLPTAYDTAQVWSEKGRVAYRQPKFGWQRY
jgi:hypothetical protein